MTDRIMLTRYEWPVETEEQAQAIFNILWDAGYMSTIINVLGGGLIVKVQI